jgi:large subunit ribosomal protein L16
MFELEGVAPEVAKRAMELAAAKLPVKCKFIVREKTAAPVEAAAEGGEA